MCESGHRSIHKSPTTQYLANSPTCAFDSPIGRRVRAADFVTTEDAVAAHRDFLMDETLARGWGENGFEPTYATEHTLDDNR